MSQCKCGVAQYKYFATLNIKYLCLLLFHIINHYNISYNPSYVSHAFFSAALGSKKDPHSCFDPVSKRGRQLAAGRVGSRYMYVPGSETIMRTEGSPASGVPGVASTPCEVKNDHRCRRGDEEEEGGGGGGGRRRREEERHTD